MRGVELFNKFPYIVDHIVDLSTHVHALILKLGTLRQVEKTFDLGTTCRNILLIVHIKIYSPHGNDELLSTNESILIIDSVIDPIQSHILIVKYDQYWHKLFQW